jgi:hypothetical protein
MVYKAMLSCLRYSQLFRKGWQNKIKEISEHFTFIAGGTVCVGRTLLLFNSDISLKEISRTSETFLSANLTILL